MSQGIRTFVRVVLGAVMVWSISGCSSTTSYPAPEEFAKRWNAQPVRRDVDDQAVMQIDQWSECSPGSGPQCLMARVCAGHGRVIATKGANSDDYNYGIVINQGYAMAPSGALQCPTALQRATNALYDSATASQEALAPLAKQPELYKVVNGTYSSVTKVQAPNGLVSEFMPTIKGDTTVHELAQFWDAHDITILVTRKSATIDSPNEAKAPEKTDDGIDADQLKRQVIAQIAAEHNFSPNDVTQFDASVEKLSDADGHPAYKVTGNFVVETTQPSNVYEAAQGTINSNVCAVAPPNDPACHRGGFKHTVYFDTKASLTQKLNGQQALNLDGRAGVDKTLEQIDQEAAAKQAAQTAEPKDQRAPVDERPWGALPSSANPTASDNRRSSNEAPPSRPDSPPRLISEIAPKYPPQAVRERLEGAVIARVEVSIDGTVRNAQVTSSSGYRALDQAAEEAARKMRFEPAYKGGAVSEGYALLPFNFSLSTGASSAGTVPTDNLRSAMQVQGDSPASGNGIASRPAPSFDCTKATTPTEIAICGSEELSRLDFAVAQKYRILMATVPTDRGASLKQAQRDWLRARSQCAAESACLQRSMEERLQALERFPI